MGDFRKNILKTDLEGKILTRKYLAKKIPTLEKISSMAYTAGKILFSASFELHASLWSYCHYVLEDAGKRKFNSFRKLFVDKSSLCSNKEKNDN